MKKILYILGVVVSFMTTMSCDDGLPCYEPGSKTADGCMVVYFNSSNIASNTVSPSDKSITITVSRKDSTKAASVPVEIVSGNTALTFPSSVEFAEGKSTANYTISFSNLQAKVNYPFEIKIADDYVDHYAKTDGSSTFTGNILMAEWIKYREGVKFYWQSTYKKVVSDVEQLDGQNLYRIQNFLGSGQELKFKFGACSTAGKAEIIPVSGFINADSNYQRCWYLYNDDNQQYVSWTPTGSTKGINYFMVLTEYYGYGLYSYLYNPNEDQSKATDYYYGYFYGYVYYSDGTSGYNYVSFQWDND